MFHSGFGLAYKTSYVIGVYSAILSLFLLAEIVVRTVFREPLPQLGDVKSR
ncbi:hypothetical protein [Paenibacillus glucanolyticus]|uniref:hypothetical protein n=1 Tax=Paenibacillus glucanolyticus TaxID=59843 RepID=UPI000A646976